MDGELEFFTFYFCCTNSSIPQKHHEALGLFLLSFVCTCVCMHTGAYVHVGVHSCVSMWRAENNRESHSSGGIYLSVLETLSLSSLVLTV